MLEGAGEPAEPQAPPSPLDIPATRLCQQHLSPHLSRCRFLLGPRDPQRLLHVLPHLSSQAAALMGLTVLFVILQSRVLALQSKGEKKESGAEWDWHRSRRWEKFGGGLRHG